MEFGALQKPLGPIEAIVRETLAPSIARDPCEDLDDLLGEFEAGKLQLWLISEGDTVRGVVATQIVGRDGEQLFIRHCAGRGIRDWLHFLEAIKDWARSMGCTSAEFIGRDGFERLLPGWSKQAVVMRAAL